MRAVSFARLLSATDIILGRRAFAVARPETAMTYMKLVESFSNDLLDEPGTQRELSTRSPAQEHLVCVYQLSLNEQSLSVG